jgi:ribosomal protein L9
LKKIVESYKGKIWIESVLGEGATFTSTKNMRIVQAFKENKLEVSKGKVQLKNPGAYLRQ